MTFKDHCALITSLFTHGTLNSNISEKSNKYILFDIEE